jgi:glycosyltransferase involved in cell wall biosynthesis
MKIAIIGAKGIPANYGGYETFAEQIALVLKENHEVLVVGDGSNDYQENVFKGIHTLNSNYVKSNRPIKFYHDSLKIANNWGADASVMCGIGGVFSIPFFRRSKMRIFVNPDGLGFKREKWVWWKKIALFIQFMFGALFSKYLICDSIGISDFFKNTFKRTKHVFVAEYGSDLNTVATCNDLNCEDYLEGLKIAKDNYLLIVSRLEPENNVEIIIKGYLKSTQKLPLIIVGNTNTTHAKKLMQFASDNVRFIEGVYDQNKLSTLRLYCKAYFHGHSVGGTNPSLLEAMGSGNLTIAHDNVFNREVLDNKAYFFKNDTDVADTLKAIESESNENTISSFKQASTLRIQNYYTWENIADKYVKIFNAVIND